MSPHYPLYYTLPPSPLPPPFPPFSLRHSSLPLSLLFHSVTPPLPLLSHAQVLGTLQAFTHWLSQLHLTSLRQQQHSESFSSILSTAVDAAVPLIAHDTPEKILLAACQLLLSLVSTVRPQLLASLPAMQGLLRRASDSQLRQLSQRVRAATSPLHHPPFSPISLPSSPSFLSL